jgi:predicted RNA-binding Zn-ribbon protein involved in translation (DUF1610 family)
MEKQDKRLFGCAACGHSWPVGHGVQRPEECPSCGGRNIHRMSETGGFGGGRRGGGKCRGYRTGLQRRGFSSGMEQERSAEHTQIPEERQDALQTEEGERV